MSLANKETKPRTRQERERGGKAHLVYTGMISNRKEDQVGGWLSEFETLIVRFHTGS